MVLKLIRLCEQFYARIKNFTVLLCRSLPSVPYIPLACLYTSPDHLDNLGKENCWLQFYSTIIYYNCSSSIISNELLITDF